VPVVDRSVLAETLLQSSSVLVAIAVRSVAGGPPEVTVAQHRVLVLLAENGPCLVKELTALLGINQSNVSRHCARLEQLGLVSRRRSPQDGRASEVGLTPAGRRQVARVTRARLREIRRVLEDMPDAQLSMAHDAFCAFNRAAAGSADVASR